MSRELRNYPPVGSADRLDEIMQRGAGMRRRRRVLGASSAGIMGVAALVVVVTLGRGPAPTTHEVATSPDDGTTQEAPETQEPNHTPETRGTTDTTDPRHEPLSVDIDEVTNQIKVFLDDPWTPSPTDPTVVADSSFRTQQCVLVSVTHVDGATTDSGPARTFEAHACREITFEDPNPPFQTLMEPTDATDVSIGCAAVEERFEDPIEMTTVSAATEFVAPLDAFGIISGDYEVTVTGISGFGDGCPDGDPLDPADPDGDGSDPDSPQRENIETLSKRFTIDA